MKQVITLFFLVIYICPSSGQNPKFVETINRSKVKAESGDTAAALELGSMYLMGYQVEENKLEARYWFEKRATLESVISMYNVGLLYAGDELIPDYDKARFWYEKAAGKEHAAAMNNLGMMYAEGMGKYGKGFFVA